MGHGAVRRWLIAAGGVMALTLAGASLAWACTSQAVTFFGSSDGAASGPANSWVTVRGENWAPGLPVEIRWNSLGGAKMEATPAPVGPTFSTSVRIPADARPGVYTIYFIQYGGSSAQSVTGTSRLPFEVTRTTSPSSDPAPSGSESSPGRTNGSTNGGQAAEGGETSSADGGEAGTAPQRNGQSFGGFGSPSSGSGGDAQTPTAGTAGSAAAPTGATSGAQGPLGSNSAAPTAQSAQGAPTSATAASPGQPVPVPRNDEANIPVGRTTSGDLWSGFDATTKGSLLPSLSEPTGSAGPGSSLAIGFALLTLGLLTMMAGFGAAEMRRKRVLAGRVTGK